MTTHSDNPYQSPTEAIEPLDRAGLSLWPRNLLFGQVVAAAICVLAGGSETDPSLAWAKGLVPLALTAFRFQVVSSVMLVAASLRDGLSKVVIAAALVLSTVLVLVSYLGFLLVH